MSLLVKNLWGNVSSYTTNTWEVFYPRSLLQSIILISAQLNFDKVVKKCKNETFNVNFSLKNISSGRHFLITSIFKSLYFLKLCPIFDTSLLHQFSKFNNFLWVCWFLGKNLSNFVPPAWKLNNPYYHTGHPNLPDQNKSEPCVLIFL